MAMSKEASTPQPDDDLDLSDRMRIFLEGIRAGMSYVEAADHAGVHRATTWRWRQDPEFAAQVKQAEEVSVDQLKREAHRRAMRGSDRLLEFLLVNRAPEEFQRVQNINLAGHLSLSNMTEDEIRAELAALGSAGIVALDHTDDDISDLV